ncbi:MAG: hypothetical protein Q8R15_04510, partial [Candidatus Micrarchaeota archaeon]|nr:hypothetical protein [Candidatus Micrarchaeota archaeon]
SSVAILRGSEEGNGTLQANVGSGFAANSTVKIVSADGFRASQLIVYPASPFRLANGQVMAVDTDFFVVGRNASGVFGPLPGAVSLRFNNPAHAAFATVLPGGVIQGVGLGQADLNISSGNLSTIIQVIVTGCTPDVTQECTASEAGFDALLDGQLKTCLANGTWGSCTDIDFCNNLPGASIPAPVQGPADNVICPNWCQSATGDLDCACDSTVVSQRVRVCSDSATHCWGTFTCGSDNLYSSCIASPSCTGALFDGTIIPSSSGYFNGFLCASTTSGFPSSPSVSTLSSSQLCRSVGSTAVVASIATPSNCQATQNVPLELVAFPGPERPVNQLNIRLLSRDEILASFKLTDVTRDNAMLNVTDRFSGTSFPLLMQLNNPVSYTANITLIGTNLTYVRQNSINKLANFTFGYNSCLYRLSVIPIFP